MSVEISIDVGLANLAKNYDVIACDIWGVLHNGVRAFPQAIDALLRFREQGGRVILITNAPRLCDGVAQQLAALGVPDEAYDSIITSGDITRDLMAVRDGQSFFHLGPQRDRPMFRAMNLIEKDIKSADFILCTGLFDDARESPEDYRILLEQAVGRDQDMICVNPDFIVTRGDKMIYCAGALAALFAELGGRVFCAGKPHAPIYDGLMTIAARITGSELPRERILAIGDGVDTDLAGAAAAGLDSVMILGGIHEVELREGGALAIAERLASRNIEPVALMPYLAW